MSPSNTTAVKSENPGMARSAAVVWPAVTSTVMVPVRGVLVDEQSPPGHTAK